MTRSWQPGAGPRSPWKTRYFLDTEFTGFDTFQLISLAIVGEDGREFYGECSDFQMSLCSDFVRSVVVPNLGRLPGRSMPAEMLREDLSSWLRAIPLRPRPVLCYDFARDMDLFERLLGGALPIGWKVEDVAQKIDGARRAAFLENVGIQHHALHDARANAFAYR